MMFGWILIIVVIILAVWYFSQGRTRWLGNGKQQQEDSPLEVLKKRYARGEISKEEYEEQKKTLNEEYIMQYIWFIWSPIILGIWSAIHTVSGKSISPFLFKTICAQEKAGKRGDGLIFVALVVEACRLFSSTTVKVIVNHKNDKS